MSSFFGRLKNNTGISSPGSGASPTSKKDSNASLSPLEALLADAGPLRSDGSDKFFGIQNPSNTCYCNSVVQCLYYSEPFRENIINFPTRPTAERLKGLGIEMSPTPNGTAGGAGGQTTPASPPAKQPDTPRVPGRFTTTPTSPNMSGTRVEETHKDTFDYMKKMAVQNGPFTEISYDNSQTYGMQTSLFTGLKDIFEAIVAQRSRVGVFALNKFLQTLRENFDTFRTPLHQDAHEFLNILLNDVVTRVSDHSKQKDESSGPSLDPSGATRVESSQASAVPGAIEKASTSWVHELFEGTLTSETRCLTCETVSQRDEAFLDLSVDLDEHSSVTSCLRRFSEEEMLCERNKFHCDQCSGLQEAEKRMKIKRLPRILALHLKRFKYTEELGRLQKLFHRVVFPFHLRLFNTTDDTEDPDRLYELYAIIVHLGSTPFHGHYVSIIKTKECGWLLFDDELVLPVDKNYVRNFFGGDPRNPACAYVLFYQQTTVEAMMREQEAERLSDVSLATGEKPDTSPISRKANGVLASDADQLGIVHRPPVDDPTMASLDHTLSAPLLPVHNPLTLSQLEHVTSSPSVATHGLGAPQAMPAHLDSEKKVFDRDSGRESDSHIKTGSFSRFRPSNLSLRQKQKQRASSSQEAILIDGPESSPAVPTSPPEKSKLNRFSLGKKKSPFLS